MALGREHLLLIVLGLARLYRDTPVTWNVDPLDPLGKGLGV